MDERCPEADEQDISVSVAMRKDLSDIEICALLQGYFRSLIGEGSLENLQKTLLFSLINGVARSSRENPRQNDATLLDLAPIGDLSAVSAKRDRWNKMDVPGFLHLA